MLSFCYELVENIIKHTPLINREFTPLLVLQQPHGVYSIDISKTYE